MRGKRQRMLATLATAATMTLAACGGGGGGGSSAPETGTPPLKITAAKTEERLRKQAVLRSVKPEPLWASGATGHGVKVAIEDDPVDILSPEFEGRIARSGGGVLLTYFPEEAYEHYLRNGEIQWVAELCPQDWTCRQFNVRTVEEGERQVQNALRQAGSYPSLDDGELWVVRVTDTGGPPGEDDLAPYYLLADPHARLGTDDGVWRHGTLVASAAVGKEYGIAPGATVVPDAITLGAAGFLDQGAASLSGDLLGGALYAEGPFGAMSNSQRRELDEALAEAIRDDQKKADIVNQSYGIGSFSDRHLRWQHRTDADFYDALDARLPQTSRAIQQEGVAEGSKTFYVTAAGNDSEDRSRPQPGAAMALFYPELRGLAFAAAALGEDGTLAAYSNRCGRPDLYTGEFAWDASRHGRHYCLAAPGSVSVVDPDGSVVTVEGTSFAAPIVSGGLALLKEHFRGRLAPREIGLRMVNTADNTGIYADAATYGAGVLDLAAAMQPVGTAATGLPGAEAAMDRSVLHTPASWGDVGARVRGVELAAFDDWNAPFWSDLSSRVNPTRSSFSPPDPGAVPIPTEAEALQHLSWRSLGERGTGRGLAMAVGTTEPGILTAFALSGQASAGSDLRVGLLYEGGANQGAQASGAFGSGVTSRAVFASREHALLLGEGPWSIDASWTLLAGEADYPSASMVETGPGLYTAGSAALVHSDDGVRTRLEVSQPLRAESGSGTFRFPYDRTVDGERLYREHGFSLAPDARELRLSVRHDRGLLGGRVAVEAGHAVDAGHQPGEGVTFAGVGYRLGW